MLSPEPPGAPRLLNRELGLLAFNERVLALADTRREVHVVAGGGRGDGEHQDFVGGVVHLAVARDAYDAAKDESRRRKFDAATVAPGMPRPADHINPPIQNCSGCHR